MKDESKIQDIRSTGRRKARKELFVNYVPYCCSVCGVTTKEPPKDAPNWFQDIWPEERRELTYQLQADHHTKDLTVNDVNFLSWKCSKCHKEADSKTGKGESTIEENYFGS